MAFSCAALLFKIPQLDAGARLSCTGLSCYGRQWHLYCMCVEENQLRQDMSLVKFALCLFLCLVQCGVL
jgi:hypothetical protein